MTNARIVSLPSEARSNVIVQPEDENKRSHRISTAVTGSSTWAACASIGNELQSLLVPRSRRISIVLVATNDIACTTPTEQTPAATQRWRPRVAASSTPDRRHRRRLFTLTVDVDDDADCTAGVVDVVVAVPLVTAAPVHGVLAVVVVVAFLIVVVDNNNDDDGDYDDDDGDDDE